MNIIPLCIPTSDELFNISQEYNLDFALISDGLDINERPRIQMRANEIIVIFSTPFVCNPDIPNSEACTIQSSESNAATHLKGHYTVPVMLIFCEDNTIIITNEDEKNFEHLIKPEYTQAEFLVKILDYITSQFLKELKTIYKKLNTLQANLRSRMTNEDLLSLLAMQNCLIYYSSALDSNELILERIMRSELSLGSNIKLHFTSEHRNDLDSVLTDLRQAIHTAQIYTQVMDSLSRTFSTITGNNVNEVMKVLTALNLVIMIPALITSAYGMNVNLPGQEHVYAFIILCLISILGSLISLFYFRKKGWL